MKLYNIINAYVAGNIVSNGCVTAFIRGIGYTHSTIEVNTVIKVVGTINGIRGLVCIR